MSHGPEGVALVRHSPVEGHGPNKATATDSKGQRFSKDNEHGTLMWKVQKTPPPNAKECEQKKGWAKQKTRSEGASDLECRTTPDAWRGRTPCTQLRCPVAERGTESRSELDISIFCRIAGIKQRPRCFVGSNCGSTSSNRRAHLRYGRAEAWRPQPRCP